MSALATIALAAVAVSVASGATLKYHSLEVSENGALFKQKTQIDLKNRVIYIHVPGHKDVPKSVVMYEFSTGRVLRCTQHIKRCYLSNFDTKGVPGPGEEEFDVREFAQRHNSPQTEEKLEKDVRQDMVVTEKIKDLTILTKQMKKALGDYPLYREEPLPKDAVILEGTLDLNKKQEKRQFGHACPHGAAPVFRYARTTPSCNRMVMCPVPTDPKSCHFNHYHGIDFYRCLCCPGQMKPDQCQHGCIIMK